MLSGIIRVEPRTEPARNQGMPMTKLLPRVDADAGASAGHAGRGGKKYKKKTIRRKYKKQRGKKSRKYLWNDNS